MNAKRITEMIMEKKDFSVVPEDFILRNVEEYLAREKIQLDKLSEKDAKEIVKQIRADLRNVVGVFQLVSVKKRYKLLEMMKNYKDKEILNQILETHISTNERAEYYEELYKSIFENFELDAKKEIRVIDLGCGINPTSIVYFDEPKKIFFKGVELSSIDVDFLKKFYNKFGFHGEFESADIINYDFSRRPTTPRPPAQRNEDFDLCFMFKVLDAIENIKRNYSEELIKKVPAKNFVVSFATRSLSGKKKIEGRKWFAWMLERNNWKYKILEFPGEIYYLFRKE